MSIQLITVTGTYRSLNGPATGTVEFRPSAVLSNTLDDEITFPIAYLATLVDGSFTVDLPATDNLDIVPDGWTYFVTERIDRSNLVGSYSIEVPSDSPGGTLDMSDVVRLHDPKELVGSVLGSVRLTVGDSPPSAPSLHDVWIDTSV